MDPILAAIQATLNSEGDGWQAASHVLILGCERMADGYIESDAFRYTASNQARWVTNGLLDEAEEMRDVVEDAE